MSEFPERMTEPLSASTYREPFSYDGYQILRRELFARIREPAVVIRTDSLTFNTACINGLEDTVYIDILINTAKKSIAIMRSDCDSRDAQRWCIDRPDKRKTRRIKSTRFTQRIYDLMNWSDKCRYKVNGEKKDLKEGTVYFFDLQKCDIIFEKKKKTKAEVLSEPPGTELPPEERAARQAEEQRMTEKPFYPDDWGNSFGVPVDQGRKFDIKSFEDMDSYTPIRPDDSD